MIKGFKYGEITGDILKCSFEVYRQLGYGFLEKVYENAMVIELRLLGHVVLQQFQITVSYDHKNVGSYFADLMVDGKVIVEVKVSDVVADQHRNQLINYLRATDYEVGMVICFGRQSVNYKRVVNTHEYEVT